MKKRGSGFVAIGLLAVSAWAAGPSVGPNLSPDVSGSTASPEHDALIAVPFPPRQPDYKLSDRAYRELDASVEVRRLLAPRVLFTRDLAGKVQLQAAGGPIAPIPGETSAGREQARFPLLIVAW